MKTLHAAINPALFTTLIDLCGLTEHNDIDGTGLPGHASLKKELAAWLPKTQRPQATAKKMGLSPHIETR